MEEVWKILDSADVVFGIWQDPTELEGVGYLPIKGEHRWPTSSPREQRIRTSSTPSPARRRR